MESIVKNFEENIESIFEGFNENSRGYAWYDLNEAFANESFFTDQKAKDLFIYLANWGMVARGSFLMKHTWRILKSVIEILQKSEYKELRNPEIETIEKNIDLIIQLRDEIGKSLKTYHENKTVSYTLISKILLGTLGCIVAYDRNVKQTLSESEIAFPYFNKKSISALCEYYIQNKTDFENLRKKVENLTNKECPPFKLLDLVLWSAASANNGDESEE